ncbi:MAG: hypothetical protein R3B47_04210 [Bacteroidia bacterium]
MAGYRHEAGKYYCQHIHSRGQYTTHDRTCSGAAAAGAAPAATASPANDDDLVLPNIRPSNGSAATAGTSANMRTAGETPAEASPSGDKGLGLFKFYAQRVTAQGYGVQV